jgi:putative hydrolase of the HAD superfamily
MIKGFLFDLDGTLLDRDSSLKGFISNQYDRFIRLHSIEKPIFMEQFIALDKRGYVSKDKVYQQMIQEHGFSLSYEDLLDDYIKDFRQYCIGFPNLHETLQYLKNCGMKLGIITNGYGDFQRNNIKALGIEDYFDTILISEIEGIKKPNPEIFNRALGNMGLLPGEAVFVGDHPENDIAASMRVGMKGVWKEDLYYDGIFERDYTIHDLLELKEMIV